MLSNQTRTLSESNNVHVIHKSELFYPDLALLSEEKELESSPSTNSYNTLKQAQVQCLALQTSSNVGKQEVIASEKKTKNIWKRQEQLEYFYATIQFSYNFPHYTLSWDWWKPDRFFNYLQEHMKNIFGIHGKLSRHCKAKDQYFKQLSSKKAIKSPDLLEFCMQRLTAFVKGLRNIEKKGKALSMEQTKRAERFERAIKEYRQCLQRTEKDKQYEIELEKLMDYSQLVKQKIQQLYSFKVPF